MKLRRLELLRYGHLTDAALDFPDNALLHVVLGANEAGKSTALSAIADALYGFGHRTGYDFLHGAAQLRIGFTLAASDGTQASFVRRKGRRDTLRDPADQVVSDDALRRFLGGVGRELFERGFGLDGVRLREGGQELLRLGGEAGESLLAGSGLLNLRSALARIEDEAKSLVGDGRGRRRLSEAVDAWRKAQREAEDCAIPPRAWQDADAAYADAVAALAEVQQRMRDLTAENHRLQRVRRVTPVLARLADAREALAQLADAPHLPPDAETRFRALQAARRDATRDLEREAADLQRLTAEREKLPQDHAALAAQDAIDALATRQPVVLQAIADRVTVQTNAAALRAKVVEAIEDLALPLTPETARDALPAAAVRRKVERLIRQHAGLAGKVDSAIQAVATARRRHGQAEQALQAAEAPPSPVLLRRTVDAVRAEGPLDAELDRAQRTVADAAAATSAGLAALPLWRGDIAGLIACPLPLPAKADAVALRLDTGNRQCAEARLALTRLTDELAAVAEEIVRLTRGETIPTPDAVAAARAARDGIWRLVRRVLEGGAPPPKAEHGAPLPDAEHGAPLPKAGNDGTLAQAEGSAPSLKAEYGHPLAEAEHAAPLAEAEHGGSLADRFESLRDAADRLADRRAADAQRVADFLSATSQRDLLRARCQQATAELAGREAALREAETAWQRLWQPAGVTPETPAAMAEWRRARADMVRLAQDEAEARRHLDDVAARRDRARAALAALLPDQPATASLAALLLQAATACDAAEAAEADYRARRKAVTDEAERLAEQQQAADAAHAALLAWQQDWTPAAAALCLPPDAAIEAAEAALAAWQRIAEAVPAWRSDADRVAAMTASIDSFTAEAHAAQAQLGETDAGEPAPAIAGRLSRRLAQARKAAQEGERLGADIAAHAAAAADATRRRDAAEAELAALRGMAAAADDAALEITIERARRRDTVAADRDRLEQALQGQGDGIPEDALRAEAAGIEPDAAVARIAEIDAELAGLGERLKELSAQRTNADRLLAEMRAGHDAASRAQEAADALAEARAAAERYARLRVAAVLLRAGIDRFRKEQQGPLLRAAGGHFALLTGGRYERLVVDYDASGRPVLLAIRDTGAECPVEALSEGARDQLYLALRVAAVEAHAAQAEPLPFIADDLLVHFDDVRAAAAVRLLTALGRSTQVILFTHHDHIAALAGQHPGVAVQHMAPTAVPPAAAA